MPLADPAGISTNSLIFEVNNLAANQTRILKYQMIVGAGVSFGTYENRATAISNLGGTLSNTAGFEVDD